MLVTVLTIISSVSFLYYVTTLFFNAGMKAEFERYGLNKFRKLIGCLQLMGGIGLLAGLLWQPILVISSGGLALLMLIAFGVRLKMKDGFLESMPSFIFMALNGYVCLVAVGWLGR